MASRPMFGAWCRFCGAMGIPDRLVCSNQDCLNMDLMSTMVPTDTFGVSQVILDNTAITMSRMARSGDLARSPSPRRAMDIGPTGVITITNS